VSLAVGVRRLEEGALLLALALLALLPLADALGRPLGGLHVPGSADYVQQLTLWIAFVGALVATREGKHLTLSTAELLGDRPLRRAATSWPRRCRPRPPRSSRTRASGSCR
jgi:TRAP-type C4-dicarboxylate transport system permease small subunit